MSTPSTGGEVVAGEIGLDHPHTDPIELPRVGPLLLDVVVVAERVEADDVVTVGREMLAEVGTDEPGRTGDQHLHVE